MKKIIYLAAIAAALFLAVHSFYLRQTPVSDFGLGINFLISFFLIVFGAYGLYKLKTSVLKPAIMCKKWGWWAGCFYFLL